MGDRRGARRAAAARQHEAQHRQELAAAQHRPTARTARALEQRALSRGGTVHGYLDNELAAAPTATSASQGYGIGAVSGSPGDQRLQLADLDARPRGQVQRDLTA